jgi:hypothetical protein
MREPMRNRTPHVRRDDAQQTMRRQPLTAFDPFDELELPREGKCPIARRVTA